MVLFKTYANKNYFFFHLRNNFWVNGFKELTENALLRAFIAPGGELYLPGDEWKQLHEDGYYMKCLCKGQGTQYYPNSIIFNICIRTNLLEI